MQAEYFVQHCTSLAECRPTFKLLLSKDSRANLQQHHN